MKTLIYIDPGCSGLQVAKIKKGNEKEILKVLAKNSIDENSSADVIYYVVVHEDGTVTEGNVNFS